MYGVRLLVTRAGRVPYIARGRELYADGHRTATQVSMDALPSEVKLLVVENTVSVADLRDLRSSSQSWGAVVDLGIRHWLRVQPMGTTMQPFLPADLEFALRISVRHGGSSLTSLRTPSLLDLHGAPPELTELLSFYPTFTLIV
jgi:hypothetical protein